MPNFCALAHRHFKQMAISGPDAVPMIDFDHLTIAALLSGKDNRARRGGIHRGLSPTGKVESIMHRPAICKGIAPFPKAASEMIVVDR